jgi:hypothetical protein
MKAGIKIFLPAFAVLLSLAGCVTLRPFPVTARVENLQIAPSAKLPLSAAIVIPDPMGFRILVTSRRYNVYGMEMQNVTQDRTSMYGEKGAPVGTELSRVAGDVFSQVLARTLTLRQPPQTGEYEAVIDVRIRQVNMMNVIRSSIGSSKMESEITLDYEVTVLDNKGVEIFHAKARTPVEKSQAKGFNVTEAYMNGIGAALSNAVTNAARDAGLMVYTSEEVKRYAGRLQPSP